jgi:hypothetical protein
MSRLNRVAEEVAQKQMLVIEEGGAVFDASVDGKALALVGSDGESEVPFVARDLVVDGLARNFKLEVLGFDRASEQVQLRVTVRTAEPTGAETVSTEFWLGHFDFPMIDNTRLPHDQRLAVVLNNFDGPGGRADLTLAYFPGKYAGLREKPYYDEVLAKLLAANQGTAAARKP